MRKMAEKLSISPVYMSNIENNRTPAPKNDVLERMSRQLKLQKKEREWFYELAAKSKTYLAVPSDLLEYIVANELVRAALRKAKDVGITDAEWIECIEAFKAQRRGSE